MKKNNGYYHLLFASCSRKSPLHVGIVDDDARSVLNGSKQPCCHLWVHHECLSAIKRPLKRGPSMLYRSGSILGKLRSGTARAQCSRVGGGPDKHLTYAACRYNPMPGS